MEQIDCLCNYFFYKKTWSLDKSSSEGPGIITFESLNPAK